MIYKKKKDSGYGLNMWHEHSVGVFWMFCSHHNVKNLLSLLGPLFPLNIYMYNQPEHSYVLKSLVSYKSCHRYLWLPKVYRHQNELPTSDLPKSLTSQEQETFTFPKTSLGCLKTKSCGFRELVIISKIKYNKYWLVMILK